jgi:formylglycine-generating enzyme required for sulfatase activity
MGVVYILSSCNSGSEGNGDDGDDIGGNTITTIPLKDPSSGEDKYLDINQEQASVADSNYQGKKKSNSLGMEFVYIEPGTFWIGSPSGESGRGSDERQHRVTLTEGFYIQTTEVTQGQWRSIMGNNPSKFKNCGDDCPVEMVSWKDVQGFIEKLNSKEETTRYRLPTEAEWEYSARAGNMTAFANGGILELKCEYNANLDAMGWYCGNSGVSYSGCYDTSNWGGQKCAGTHPVGQKKHNYWGLYDMHGNVWEWCQDWKGDYPSGPVTNPTGPSSGSDRVNRGGCWSGGAKFCRSANRDGDSPGYRGNNLGFRLALSPGQ